MWAPCPKTWNGGKKQAFFVAQIGGGQKWAPHLFRLKSIFYKNTKKTEFTTLFEQLLLPKLLPCRFISTFIYTQREKNGIKY